MDTPDPYIVVCVPMAPDGRKVTSNIDNEPNPIWEEELTYYLPPNDQQLSNIVAEVSWLFMLLRRVSKARVHNYLVELMS